MASSQEKITEKYFNIIEKALQDTIANENTKAILREYKEVLSEELKFQKDNEKILQENLDKVTSIGDSTLETKCLKLQETVKGCEKYINQLRDDIDNLTIQSITDKETLKIEKAEKEQQIILYYEAEAAKLRKQLENDKNEHEKIEQEIKNQITLEIATKNARLGEIKSNLQKQIVERNNVLIQMQNEHKELRRELNTLKVQEKRNTNQCQKTNPKSNVMEFRNELLIQKNRTTVSNNRNEFSNVRPLRVTSAMSEYTTTETENQEYLDFANSYKDLTANNFRQSNTNFSNPNCISNVVNNTHVLSTYNSTTPLNSNSVSNNSCKDKINNSNEPNQGKRLFNQEMSYFAEEYGQFNETDTMFIADNTVNTKILKLLPNSSNTTKTAGNDKLTREKKQDSLPATKKCKLEAENYLKPTRTSQHNDTTATEDPDMFDKDLIQKNESFDKDRNSSDVPRKQPRVYVGETRQKKTYRKRDGSLFSGNYGEKGSTLNTITELNATKRK